MAVRELDTTVGDLRAVIAVPAAPPRAGLVLVDGSGPATRHEWGTVPGHLAGLGVATLRHDKPGCGGSPGDWRAQTFADRAEESLAALATLRAETGVERAGLIGYSQGGWVTLLAATGRPDAVDFVVTVSGPAVGVAEQERVRTERMLRRLGHPPAVVDEAMRWVDERAARLAVGDPPAQILAAQDRHAGRPWHAAVAAAPYDTVETLAFLARALRFDPAALIPHLRCPILALYGAADELVPVERSVAVLAERLPGLHRGRNAVAVLPGADHMLHVAEGEHAPAFLPMLGAFLDLVALS
ncbi:alpha/beta hydrolase [Dactylosporangium aurantiacum]|uniref:Alpha/beta hydrolase n=1 Tax=Dactylosporangium aurantiacum TaxID=35754 RepID=A0A9Q9MHR4_9ACTN|nr:alpha/beta hydrolase [Dactylosporangium aurantiacum]MDG6102843.1 alpha/beta hydrolase [Dactylosporangium aurantiacum]UWZ52916.1 alpha/beta hydrolase [Dactylosporangium aurantiacum]